VHGRSLVGGLICLVNSENERDLNLLNSCIKIEYILNIFSLFGKIFLFSSSFLVLGFNF